MRLLSFLSEIERAIATAAPAVDGLAWHTTRMVNFQQGIARLTLAATRAAHDGANDGAVFLQAFALADGTVCLKASLTWKGSDAFPAISVYTTPTVDWKQEARRVAAAWLEGPPALALSTSIADSADSRLVAQAG